MSRPANPRLAHEILRVAANMVEEQGPDGVTMREVAKRIGYSPTTIYVYYKNKLELLMSAVMRAFDLFADSLEQAAPAGEIVGRLRKAAQGYVAWGIDNPAMYRMMFEYVMMHSAPVVATPPPEMREVAYRSWRFQRSLLAMAVDAGKLRIDDLDEATNITWAVLHGLTSLTISGRLFGDGDPQRVLAGSREMVDSVVDLWLAAWSPR